MKSNLSLRTAHRPPVRGVLLDVFETLFSLAALRPVFAAHGLNPACVPLWLSLVFSSGMAFAAAQDYRRFHDIATHALISLAPDRIGRDEAQVVVGALQRLEPHPDARAGLALLRTAGLRVLMLTLYDAASCETLLSEAGLHDLVDGFLSVDAVRRWKPAPEPYAYGVAQIGWPAGQVAAISAHGWDIHGARRAGLQTGYILRYTTAAPAIFDAADVAGQDLPAVVEGFLSQRV